VGIPFTFHPYLMQIASVNSCLFSAYPIALIGNLVPQNCIIDWGRAYKSAAQPAQVLQNRILKQKTFTYRR